MLKNLAELFIYLKQYPGYIIVGHGYVAHVSDSGIPVIIPGDYQGIGVEGLKEVFANVVCFSIN